MKLYDNFYRRIQAIDDNLTLKDDYAAELEELDIIYSDIYTGLSFNAYSVERAAYLITWIKEIKAFMLEEMSRHDTRCHS